jgi:hypothetical protein
MVVFTLVYILLMLEAYEQKPSQYICYQLQIQSRHRRTMRRVVFSVR